MSTITKNNRDGLAGLNGCMSLFSEFSWHPDRIAQENDIGTDFIARPGQDYPDLTTSFIGLQVKTSKDKYVQAKKDSVSGVDGWWFTDNERKSDYWIDHMLPHFLILFDLSTRTSYWQNINTKTVDRKNRVPRIFVPKQQLLDKDALDSFTIVLRDYVTRRNALVEHWDETDVPVNTNDRYRFCFLTPRLIAPLRGAKVKHPIDPITLLTMSLQFRFREIDQYFALKAAHKLKGGIKNVQNGLSRKHWDWKLSCSVYEALRNSSHLSLKKCIYSAKSEDQRLIAVIATSCSLIDQNKREASHQLLITNEKYLVDAKNSTNLAWYYLLMARSFHSQGNGIRARELAAFSLTFLSKKSWDPTVSAIQASANEILNADIDEGIYNINEITRHRDNLISSWRAASISVSFDQLSHETFENLTRQTPTYIGERIHEHDRLFEASFNTLLLGFEIAYRPIECALGKARAITGIIENNDELIFDGFVHLHNANDPNLIEKLFWYCKEENKELLIKRVIKFVLNSPHDRYKFRARTKLLYLTAYAMSDEQRDHVIYETIDSFDRKIEQYRKLQTNAVSISGLDILRNTLHYADETTAALFFKWLRTQPKSRSALPVDLFPQIIERMPLNIVKKYKKSLETFAERTKSEEIISNTRQILDRYIPTISGKKRLTFDQLLGLYYSEQTLTASQKKRLQVHFIRQVKDILSRNKSNTYLGSEDSCWDAAQFYACYPSRPLGSALVELLTSSETRYLAKRRIIVELIKRFNSLDKYMKVLLQENIDSLKTGLRENTFDLSNRKAILETQILCVQLKIITGQEVVDKAIQILGTEKESQKVALHMLDRCNSPEALNLIKAIGSTNTGEIKQLAIGMIEDRSTLKNMA